MLKKILKLKDKYIFKAGYEKAREDFKKETNDIEDAHKTIVKNLIYDHDTVVIEKELDNKLLRDQIKKSSKRDKANEELRLTLKREKRILDKIVLDMRGNLDEINHNFLRRFQDMSLLLDDIENRKCKEIQE